MTAQEYKQKAADWLAEQATRVIDYQWEIQHHKEMHQAYNQSL